MRALLNRFIIASLIGLGIISAAAAASLSQGYKASGSIAPGSLVVLQHDSQSITPATPALVDNLVGVSVKPDEALLSLSSTNDETQVATSGIVNTLVTDLGGPVKAGDRITASAIAGVGMKASISGKVVGTARTDFVPTGATARPVEVKTTAGTSQTVQVGQIPVEIQVGYYTAPGDQSIVPGPLQQIFDQIARKKVSAIRIIIGLLLMLIALVVVTVLIYAAAKNSIISIGRNPLSQPAIRRSLLQVVSVATLILLVTLISVYLIISR